MVSLLYQKIYLTNIWHVWWIQSIYSTCNGLIGLICWLLALTISVDKAHIYSDSGGLGLNPSLVPYYSLILSHTHTQCIKHSLNVLNLRTYLYVHFIIERWWMISSLFITTVLEKSGLKPGAMIWLVRMVSIIKYNHNTCFIQRTYPIVYRSLCYWIYMWPLLSCSI